MKRPILTLFSILSLSHVAIGVVAAASTPRDKIYKFSLPDPNRTFTYYLLERQWEGQNSFCLFGKTDTLGPFSLPVPGKAPYSVGGQWFYKKHLEPEFLKQHSMHLKEAIRRAWNKNQIFKKKAQKWLKDFLKLEQRVHVLTAKAQGAQQVTQRHWDPFLQELERMGFTVEESGDSLSLRFLHKGGHIETLDITSQTPPQSFLELCPNPNLVVSSSNGIKITKAQNMWSAISSPLLFLLSTKKHNTEQKLSTLKENMEKLKPLALMFFLCEPQIQDEENLIDPHTAWGPETSEDLEALIENSDTIYAAWHHLIKDVLIPRDPNTQNPYSDDAFSPWQTLFGAMYPAQGENLSEVVGQSLKTALTHWHTQNLVVKALEQAQKDPDLLNQNFPQCPAPTDVKNWDVELPIPKDAPQKINFLKRLFRAH